ncbi:polymorphic toxin-type HINT domain-containing protein [Paenibacillus sp. FSL L8-0158]|uniref:polymorphic toxin-type HINT domain-containing protein n=1 Tax=Paenibacillus sp. FSL L8-0158 TaxID=2954752 RepID=UPI003158B69C
MKITYAYVLYDLSGQLWARQDKASGQLQYYQLNGHGDVVVLSDSSGKELNSYSYDIWGGPETVKETVPNVLRYAGEYWDDTTGLQYLRARWYDPGTARFMGEDTYQGEISDPQSLNWYAYVANNPLGYVDPSGHELMPTTKGGIFYTNQKTIIHYQRVGMGTCWNEFKAGTIQASTAVANFLIVDDINTILDPKSSAYDKTLALAGFIPVGKFVKGGKLIIQLTSKEGRYVGRSVELTEKNLKSAKALPCNCFTAGTKVQTDEGEKPIEEVEVGDKVLAKDDETGEMAYKEVEWLYQRDVEETYNITVGGEVITTTDEHPFWIVGKGWVKSKDLEVGDVLTTSDGKELAIEKIEVKKGHDTVYNFKVKDFHTYFVSNLGVWTHNACDIPNKTTKWDIKMNAKGKVTYKFHGDTITAYQDNTKKGYWWAKDTTGHGGSAYKVFEKKGNSLHWITDADEYGNFITGKHKSTTGTVIKLK